MNKEMREIGESDTGIKILIIDDEKNLRSSLAEFLSLEGIHCVLAASGEEGLRELERTVFDAVLLDLRMPGIDGLEVLRRIRDSGLGLPVLMMSAHGDIHDAVEAMKQGADDYLVKPFDPVELSVRLHRLVASARRDRLVHVGRRLAEPATQSGVRSPGWLGDDPAMRAVSVLVQKTAKSNTTVLITGESGTGKEVVAQELHRQSSRSEGPFVPINVSALSETLLESELFGYEKGSFTGADVRKSGLFELASGGTLFLDELGEMSLRMQVKLLRVLQERTVLRIGGKAPIPIDVRIVAATNRNLEDAVRSGEFREDLYFRLNVIRIHLPPLRERTIDIPSLATLFLERFCRETGKNIEGFSVDALDALSAYPFPGNVRELENLVERAVILSESPVLHASDFLLESARFSLGVHSDISRTESAESSGSHAKSAPPESPLSFREIERDAILSALERNNGHREKTAAELGISRRTLLNKLKEYEALSKLGKY